MDWLGWLRWECKGAPTRLEAYVTKIMTLFARNICGGIGHLVYWCHKRVNGNVGIGIPKYPNKCQVVLKKCAISAFRFETAESITIVLVPYRCAHQQHKYKSPNVCKYTFTRLTWNISSIVWKLTVWFESTVSAIEWGSQITICWIFHIKG